MAPLEPVEKVLVSGDFLETEHGEVGCVNCHGGNPNDKTKAGAHKGFDAHPSLNNPEGACGECHEDIVSTAKDSLHATLSTFTTVLKSRSDMSKWHDIDEARKGHCTACHTSCGGCHVSRPKFAKKGFIDGHKFQKRSDPFNQCTACHGSRVGMEYYGARGQGDVHVTKYDMDCVACHPAEEMHAKPAADLKGRYHLPEMVNCEDCHQGLKYGSVREHSLHVGKVQCQVCHSQTYVNCYSCHTGKDSLGLRYFQNQKEIEGMKIGLNYDKDEPNQTNKYILVRHEPTDPELFEFYVKDAFTNFDNTPNWKRASPHNIQRKTWQTANCNNCHGNRDLFLDTKDLLDYEKGANAKVVVPDNKVPKKRKKVMPLNIDTAKVRHNMVVDAKWLHDNIGKKGVKRFTAICPGPNLAYFSRIVSLREMVDHIYGRINLLNTEVRENMFIAELRMYMDHFKAEVQKHAIEPAKKQIDYLNEFKQNLIDGIEYYCQLFPQMAVETSEYQQGTLEQLHQIRQSLESAY